MNVVVLGASGMLGHKMVQVLREDHSVYAVVRNFESALTPVVRHALQHPNVSFASLENFDVTRADVVINCIGLIKQRPNGGDVEDAVRTNAMMPHNFARRSKRLIHISTDCVFSGLGDRPYLETDPTDAHDVYGKTKALGEITDTPHVTLRTSIIGPELRNFTGLYEWFKTKKYSTKVDGYINHWWNGLTTLRLAEIVRDLVLPDHDLVGLYHLGSYPISKHEILFLFNDIQDQNVTIDCVESPCPIYRVLNTDRFESATDSVPMSMMDMLNAMVRDDVRHTPTLPVSKIKN